MARTLLVHEVIAKVQAQKTKADKIKILRQHDSAALCDYLRGTFDESIHWNLPTGVPPYTAAEPHNTPSNFLKKNVDLRYFVKGGQGDRLQPLKRISMINKEKPKYITKNIVEEAFPGLIKR